MDFEDNIIELYEKQAKEIKGVRRFNGKSIEDCALAYGVPAETWQSFETAGTEMTIREHDRLVGFVYGLEGRSFDTRSHHEKMTASGLAHAFGTTVWNCVYTGLDILSDYIREDVIEMLGEDDPDIRLTDLEESRSGDFLPEMFLSRIDIPVLIELYHTAEYLRNKINEPKLERLHTIAEEMLMYQSYDLGYDLNANDPFGEFPEGFDPSAPRDLSWIFDRYLEDMDVLTFLYDQIEVDPAHPYHISHWFEDQFWMGEDQFYLKQATEEESEEDFEVEPPATDSDFLDLPTGSLSFDIDWDTAEFIAYDAFAKMDEEFEEDDENECKKDPRSEEPSDDLPF